MWDENHYTYLKSNLSKKLYINTDQIIYRSVLEIIRSKISAQVENTTRLHLQLKFTQRICPLRPHVFRKVESVFFQKIS